MRGAVPAHPPSGQAARRSRQLLRVASGVVEAQRSLRWPPTTCLPRRSGRSRSLGCPPASTAPSTTSASSSWRYEAWPSRCDCARGVLLSGLPLPPLGCDARQTPESGKIALFRPTASGQSAAPAAGPAAYAPAAQPAYAAPATAYQAPQASYSAPQAAAYAPYAGAAPAAGAAGATYGYGAPGTYGVRGGTVDARVRRAPG